MSIAALDLAATGLHVFPCLATKAPACPAGFKDAVTDPASVSALFKRYPGPLIGVAAGETSGIDVLDLDAGSDQWFDANRHLLPATRTHRTRSGGLHILFRHHPGIRNSARKLAPGVDTRGDGGYVIWWPATGLPIAMENSLAAWPAPLLEALLPQPVVATVAAPERPRGAGYAAAALYNAGRRVTRAAPGQRNTVLNRETWSMGRFIHLGQLSAWEIVREMTAAGLSAGLDPHEVERTVCSAIGAGMAR